MFARQIGGDDAVDVLRGRQQERDVLLLLDCLKDCVFDCRLVREEVVVAMQHGALEEEDTASHVIYFPPTRTLRGGLSNSTRSQGSSRRCWCEVEESDPLLAIGLQQVPGACK
jgi:hypothetical protein